MSKTQNTLERVTKDEYYVGGTDTPYDSQTHTEALTDLDDSMSRLESCLASMGMTPCEAKIFVFLARAGATKASEAAKILNLPRTQTYNLLNSLQKKGLVSATMSSPIKFVAVSVDKAMDALLDTEKQRLSSFERRKETMLNMWSSITSKVVTHQEIDEEKFQIIEGNAVYGKIKELLSSAKEEVTVIVDQRQMARLYHNGLTDYFQALRAKGISVKVLTSEPTPDVMSEIKRCEIKMLDEESDYENYIVVDNSHLVFFVKDSSAGRKPSALSTDCKSLVRCVSCLFKELWKR